MDTQDDQYFDDVFQLLKCHNYLHTFRNIDYFLLRQWEKFPNDWLPFFKDLTGSELNQLPRCGHLFSNCPESLKSFLLDCRRLSVLIDVPSQSTEHQPSTGVRKSIKEKKKHELDQLTAFVVSMCEKLNCNRVVDIGCGLGHLLRAIGNQRPLKLVGIDSDAACCSKASASFNVQHRPEFLLNKITAQASKQQLDELLLGNESDRTAIVSLHGCGDLQPTVLKWFAEADRSKAPLLIAVACCYHKMSFADDGASCSNFPLSVSCSAAMGAFRISQPSLRLACQETAVRWESQSEQDHEKHERSFVQSSLMQSFFADKGLDRLARQSRRRVTSNSNFAAFVESVLETYELADVAKSQWSQELHQLLSHYSCHFFTVEPFTALQVALQTPLESLILSDRLTFLKERGLSACLRPVFNAAISPRNMAIVAHEQLC